MKQVMLALGVLFMMSYQAALQSHEQLQAERVAHENIQRTTYSVPEAAPEVELGRGTENWRVTVSLANTEANPESLPNMERPLKEAWYPRAVQP